MSYAEAVGTGCTSSSCPSYVANQTYWLGSRSGNNTIKQVAYFIYNYGQKRELSSDTYTERKGVRPVIIVNESALTN